MADLLSRRSFACRSAGCGVVLRLDAPGSAAALRALKDLQERLDAAGAVL